jgi:hypothetical protein
LYTAKPSAKVEETAVSPRMAGYACQHDVAECIHVAVHVAVRVAGRVPPAPTMAARISPTP